MNQPVALIVCFNEARHLSGCIERLGGFDVVIADLGSADDSVQVAEAAGARVIHAKREPVVERVLPTVLPMIGAEWVLRLDPDERVPAELAAAMLTAVASARPDVGAFEIPYQYYFAGKPLIGTVWGGLRYHRRLFRPAAVVMQANVHLKDELAPGFSLSRLEGPPVQHLWADTISEISKKHARYVEAEGAAMYASGLRWSRRRQARAMAGALYANVVKQPAWKDGRSGLRLAAVFLAYVYGRWESLRRYELQHGPRLTAREDLAPIKKWG